jgi:hypothetical protein
VRGHRRLGVLGEAGGVTVGRVVPVVEGDAQRQVRQRVVRRVWSVTTSIGAFISSSLGNSSAALPSTPIESGRRSSRAATARATASSKESACSSR